MDNKNINNINDKELKAEEMTNELTSGKEGVEKAGKKMAEHVKEVERVKETTNSLEEAKEVVGNEVAAKEEKKKAEEMEK